MRINFSHATYEEAERRIDRLRGGFGNHVRALQNSSSNDDEENTIRPFNTRGVLLDLKGPEIRTGRIAGERKKIKLIKGERLTLSTDEKYKDACDESTVYVNYKEITDSISKGSVVLLDDGLISLKVTEDPDSSSRIECVVENTGLLGSTKGVNIPNAIVNLPALSEKDKKDLEYGVDREIDFVAVSFVRKKSDVETVRDFIREAGEKRWGKRFYPPLLISKIESHEGLVNFDDILDVSDGIMVARGDLGVEIPLESVFEAQKMMIEKCVRVGKPVVVATQMLESMQHSPRPTRAEVSDVANAVLDGADAVMLSGEVANGEYPVETCRMMKRTVLEAHKFLKRKQNDITTYPRKDITEFETVARAAVDGAKAFDAPLIICLTKTGRTAKIISSQRPHVPVLCVTKNIRLSRQLQIYRGLLPLVLPTLSSVIGIHDRSLTEEAVLNAKKMNLVRTGDKLVIVSSQSGTSQTETAIMAKVTTVK